MPAPARRAKAGVCFGWLLRRNHSYFANLVPALGQVGCVKVGRVPMIEGSTLPILLTMHLHLDSVALGVKRFRGNLLKKH